MRYHKILPLLLISTLFLAGCGNPDISDKTSDTPNAADSPVNTNKTDSPSDTDPEEIAEDTGDAYIPRTLEPEVITYDFQNMDIVSEDGEITYVHATYTEPAIHLEDAAAAQKIQNEFDALRSSFDAELASMYVDAKTVVDESDFPYFGLDQSFTTMRNDARVLSLQSYYYTCMGGAHGYCIYSGLNFDLDAGEKLTLDGISTDKTALLASAHDYIEELLQLPCYAEQLYEQVPTEETMDSIDSSVLTDDYWYFTDSGITFVANLYEIGPYSSGPIYFNVPYEKLDGLKPDYAYSGAYILPVPVGTSVDADLNGDGTKDTVMYEIAMNGDYAEVTPSLSVNHTDFSSIFETDDIYLSSVPDSFYLIDLDASDSFKEIAIINYGDNDYVSTHFFRYDGEDISYLGDIGDLPESTTCKLRGDGTLTAKIALGLLETRYTSAQYRISDDSRLELIPQKWYYPETGPWAAESSIHNILEDITVHTEKSLDSDTVTLTAADGPVTFPATDNEHWFVVETADGTICYLYLTDFCTTEDGRYAYDVFENLLLVG